MFKLDIPFKIADNTYCIIDNYTDYLNNEQLKETVKQVLDLDFNNITFKESFETLFGIQFFWDNKKIPFFCIIFIFWAMLKLANFNGGW